MTKYVIAILALSLIPASAFALDGVVLINQSTVMAAGGFPYMITQPGSYKLSGNLIVTSAGKDGIDINSDNVTLDLNGFTITGPGTRGPENGIASANQNITLRNGVVTRFPTGVLLTGTAAITDLQASGNGYGIRAFPSGLPAFAGLSSGFIIARCSANGNAIYGFLLSNATVSDSIANANHDSGFLVARSSLIHNVANNNALFGIISGFIPSLTGGDNPSANGGSLFGSNTMLDNTTDLYVATDSRSQGNNVCTAGSC
jgi:hypothetical protein